MIVGYFADGPWAHRTLDKLLKNKNVNIAFICTRHDRNDEVLISKSKENNIICLNSSNINSDDFVEYLNSFNCDLFISMSFNQIFKKKILELPKLGSINCHAGKLPFYRGRNVLNWAIINDEKEFGITIHYIDEGIDTGDIILQKCFPITDEDDYGTILNKAYLECANLLSEVVGKFIISNVTSYPQSSIHPVGFYCHGRKDGDEYLNWNQTSREIFNFVRAISNPGPSAQCFLNKKIIYINKVKYLRNSPNYVGVPGTILSIDQEGFEVKTQDSFIKVVDWKSEEKLKVGERFNES